MVLGKLQGNGTVWIARAKSRLGEGELIENLRCYRILWLDNERLQGPNLTLKLDRQTVAFSAISLPASNTENILEARLNVTILKYHINRFKWNKKLLQRTRSIFTFTERLNRPLHSSVLNVKSYQVTVMLLLLP